MDIQSFLQSGGRIVRQRQGRRMITIAYRKNGDYIDYGATIFRKDSPREQWSRKGQNQIAMNRLQHSPVRIPQKRFDHIGQQDEYVRRALLDYGCYGIEDAPRNEEIR